MKLFFPHFSILRNVKLEENDFHFAENENKNIKKRIYLFLFFIWNKTLRLTSDFTLVKPQYLRNQTTCLAVDIILLYKIYLFRCCMRTWVVLKKKMMRQLMITDSLKCRPVSIFFFSLQPTYSNKQKVVLKYPAVQTNWKDQ